MDEPAKPFACTIPECGMSFTNEDHLHVHTKKHDMVLQLGLEQKTAFVADQTPTPTRFIRNCEEVGLFQDLQNVSANPFDEGFKRAMETKAGILSLENVIAPSSDDALHTPQMVFPLLENSEPTLYTNNQRNVTISRSSSDESGTIKEFETRTISKLTNEVTTISRIVNEDITIKQTDKQSDIQTVSYKNNVITIESNVIRKDDSNKVPVLVYTESDKKSIVKDSNVTDKSKLNTDKVPIMSQKSIDFVVDSLTSELDSNINQNIQYSNEKTKDDGVIANVNQSLSAARSKLLEALLRKERPVSHTHSSLPKILPNTPLKVKEEIKAEDYEVTIKLPNGKQMRMIPVEGTSNNQDFIGNSNRRTNTFRQPNAKDIIRNKIAKKIPKKNDVVVVKPISAQQVKIPTGTLIPVTLLSSEGTPLSNDDLNKVPITKICNVNDIANLKVQNEIVKVTPIVATTKRRHETSDLVNVDENVKKIELEKLNDKGHLPSAITREDIINQIENQTNNVEKEVSEDDECVIEAVTKNPEYVKRSRLELESRSAASRRYRERLKSEMLAQKQENTRLREANQKLIAEKAVLKLLITEHMKTCSTGAEIAHRLHLLMNEIKDY